jgi:hypothetical protein
MIWRRHGILMTGLIVLVFQLVACSGCRELVAQLGEINTLQSQLQQQTGQTAINVNLTNDSYFNISFINSSLAKLPPDQKKAKALEVARLVYKDWAKRDQLISVMVVFQRSSDLGPVHYSDSSDNFEFQVSELKADKSPAPPGQTANPTH